MGGLADRFGRKRIAVAGSAWASRANRRARAPTRSERGWSAVVFSSFLGAMQGLSWTAMILTMMDLCGPAARGFASGLSGRRIHGHRGLGNVYGSIDAPPSRARGPTGADRRRVPSASRGAAASARFPMMEIAVPRRVRVRGVHARAGHAPRSCSSVWRPARLS